MNRTVRPCVKRRIKREMAGEKPTVWIGKSGAAASTMNEIKRQLKAQGRVKIRVLRSALHERDMDEIASQVAEETSSSIIEVRGHTFILHKPKEPKKGL